MLPPRQSSEQITRTLDRLIKRLEQAHILHLKDANAVKRTTDRRSACDTAQHKHDRLDLEHALQAQERLGRGHVDAEHERKVDDEEPDRVVLPLSAVQQVFDGLLDFGDRTEKEEAWT